jgi:hypothetical protein
MSGVFLAASAHIRRARSRGRFKNRFAADDKGDRRLKPETQGHIDGLCAVCTVVNACKLLFNHSEKMDQRLFKALCISISDLFPKIVYDGTEVVGLRRLLDGAVEWTAATHKCELGWSQPLLRREKTTVDEYFDWLRWELKPTDGGGRTAIIGLGKPWEHWTVVRSVRAGRAYYFDSWGFPGPKDSTAFSYFTFDKSRAGDGKNQKTLLMQHQTFILAAPPR